VIRYYRKNKFSLIEVLVALTIIAVSFSVYMRALSLNIKNTGVSKSYITAILLAKKNLAQLVTNDKLKEGKKKGEFGDDYPGFRWISDVKKQSKYLFLIKYSVEFLRDGEIRTLTFNTLSMNKAAFKKKKTDKKNDAAGSDKTDDKNASS
jgi:prepilin-type N-terminal cleavage/methylation domain-containing protein